MCYESNLLIYWHFVDLSLLISMIRDWSWSDWAAHSSSSRDWSSVESCFSLASADGSGSNWWHFPMHFCWDLPNELLEFIEHEQNINQVINYLRLIFFRLAVFYRFPCWSYFWLHKLLISRIIPYTIRLHYV